MKILHIASDEKFIDYASEVFEMAYPHANEVWIFSKSIELKNVRAKVDEIIAVSLIKTWVPKVPRKRYGNYDVVVFHSFGSEISPEIFNIPKNTPTVWLGWGYDYYDLIGDPDHFLLPETKNVAAQSVRARLRLTIIRMIHLVFTFTGVSKSRKKAIERLSLFSPVLPNEYHMVFRSRSWRCFPAHVRWNYGTIEDHFIKGFEGEQVDGNAILVGNSASSTCNHKDTFDFLLTASIENRKVIAPLSYGDKKYGAKTANIGKKYFGFDFHPLTEFMPVHDYVANIKQCGYVIMNHKRQQAVGNIVIMLYLGSRVFLREENPTFAFMKGLGVSISSVQQLEKDVSLLGTPLSPEEQERNKRLVGDYWSREAGIARTKALIERALLFKNTGNRVPRGSA